MQLLANVSAVAPPASPCPCPLSDVRSLCTPSGIGPFLERSFDILRSFCARSRRQPRGSPSIRMWPHRATPRAEDKPPQTRRPHSNGLCSPLSEGRVNPGDTGRGQVSGSTGGRVHPGDTGRGQVSGNTGGRTHRERYRRGGGEEGGDTGGRGRVWVYRREGTSSPGRDTGGAKSKDND